MTCRRPPGRASSSATRARSSPNHCASIDRFVHAFHTRASGASNVRSMRSDSRRGLGRGTVQSTMKSLAPVAVYDRWRSALSATW